MIGQIFMINETTSGRHQVQLNPWRSIKTLQP
jgi:hypothetical protein